MKQNLFLGDEAIAQAALDAGISGVYSYPGTPSTEITAYIQNSPEAKEHKISSRWRCNEKTALEGALGMSYAGKRSLSCMKHVGLNVAMDPFMNTAMSGIYGGMIVVVADDPSMHSSQNEQDSRVLGNFAMIPMFEPSNQQEAYDMVYSGFELSEHLGYPILLRITTRLAHSRSGVVTRPRKEPRPLSYPEDGRQRFILLPAIARKRLKVLIEKQSEFLEASENSPYNNYFDAPDKSKGIIAGGIGFNYLSENFPEGFEHPVIKISQYPLPYKMIERMARECSEILLIEEGFPFIEKELIGLPGFGLKVHGRLDGTLNRDGELNPDNVGRALGKAVNQVYEIPPVVEIRPPSLCQGCGHRDVFEALNEVLKEYESPKVFSDIGCYTLGALPPFRAIDTCIDMGAAITMSKGASDAGCFPSLSVIGDSTFAHSGMTGLLDCVNDNNNMVVIISDNKTTAMTGGQDSAGTGHLEEICAGIGVNPAHIRVIVPLKKNFEEMKNIIREEIEYNGLSVIIPRRECIQVFKRKKKQTV